VGQVRVKILGISGTPIKGGNCDTMVQEALKAAEEVGDVIGGVETEFITMADKEVAMCQHCQWCVENRAPCKIKDDLHMIYDKIEQCDGLILGGPTWALTLAPPLVNLFSRVRYTLFFTHKFRNKVVGALTVGFFGYGLDKALDVIESMASGATGFVVARGWAVASTAAFGERAAYMEHGVKDDTAGMNRVRNVGIKVVEIARMVKYATEAGIVLPDEFTRTRIGARIKPREDKVLVDGVWRDKA